MRQRVQEEGPFDVALGFSQGMESRRVFPRFPYIVFSFQILFHYVLHIAGTHDRDSFLFCAASVGPALGFFFDFAAGVTRLQQVT